MANDVVSGDFLRVLLTLKNNIMKDLHCCELAIVKKVYETNCDCSLLSNPNTTINVYKLPNIECKEQDIVQVIFSDNDFRNNYLNIINNQSLQNIDSKIKHSLDYGLIVGNVSDKSKPNLPVGSIITFAIEPDDNSYQRLDGRNLLQNGMYEEFCKWLKAKVSKDPTSVAIYTIEEYANIMDTYGQCGGFVINNTGVTLTSGTYSVDANSIKLPTITEFIASNNSGENIGVSELDEFKSHQHKLMRYNSQYQAGYGVGTHTGTIAETATTVYVSEILTNNIGGSETKPKNIRYPYYIVVSNGIQDNIQINLNNIINDINNINDKIKNVENVETIYDSSSPDANINWGYTNGISSSTGVVPKNLTKYKKLIGTVQWRNPTDVINQYSGYGQVVCDLTKSFGENYYCGQNTFVTFNEINYLWSVNCKLYVTINKDGVEYAGYYANSANETNTTAGILIKLEGVY